MDNRSQPGPVSGSGGIAKKIVKALVGVSSMLLFGVIGVLATRVGGASAKELPSASSSDASSGALVTNNEEQALTSIGEAVALSNSSGSMATSSSVRVDLDQADTGNKQVEPKPAKFDTSDLQFPGSLARQEETEVAEKKTEASVSQATVKEAEDTVEEDADDEEEIEEVDTSDPRYRVPHLGGSTSNSTQCTFSSEVKLADSVNGWGTGLFGETNTDAVGTVVGITRNFFVDDNKPGVFITAPGALGGAGVTLLIRQDSWPTSIDLFRAPTYQVTQIKGVAPEDYSGTTAVVLENASANNTTCLAIGSAASPHGKKWAGVTYVVCDDEAMPNPVYLSEYGLRINGQAANDQSSSGLGTVFNAKTGRNHLVIGSPGAQSDRGTTDIIVSPLESLGPELNLTSPSPHIFRIIGDLDDTSGYRLSGTFNFTGHDESNLAIGAPQIWIGGPGKAYIVCLGDITGNTEILATNLNDGVNGHTLVGSSDVPIGTFVEFIRDITGDNSPELAVTAQTAASGAGKVVILCGSSTLPGTFSIDDIDALALNAIVIVGAPGDGIGTSVKVADLFGNGVRGLIIGASQGDGTIYYIVPKEPSWPRQISLATPPNSVDVYKWSGVSNSNAGTSIAVGRLNNDQSDDVVIGAPKTREGSVVVFGGCDPESVSLRNNDLTIRIGDTVIIDETNLAALNPRPGISFSIPYISGGSFSEVGQSGIPIGSFPASKVADRAIQATASSELECEVVVRDGLRQSSPQTVRVVNLGPPALLANAITANQNQMVNVSTTALSAAAIGAKPADITLRFAVQNGWFLLRPTMVKVTNATQESIIDERLVFQVADTQIAPTGLVYLECNGFVVGPFPLNITFDSYPVIDVNAFVVGENRVNLITQAMVRVSHATRDPATLVLHIFNVLGGEFTVNNVSTTTFPQGMIGNVSFVSVGSIVPSFSFSAYDGTLQSPIVPGQIKYVRRPVVDNSQVTIGALQMLPLDPSMLSATDPNPNSNSQNLVYHISRQQDCFVDSALNPGAAIVTFSQSDITSGSLRITATGPNPQLAVRVSTSDGVAITDEQNVSITCVQAPAITKNKLVIGANGAVVLTLDMINVQDSRYSPANIIVKFSEAVNCQVTLTSDHSQTITSCTLEQIANGEITIIAGSGSNLSYKMTVSNPVLAAIPIDANVEYHLAPTLRSDNDIELIQGSMIPVDAMFNVSTVEDPSAVRIVFVKVMHGRFYPTDATTNITLQDVMNQRFQYRHDNSHQTPTVIFYMLTPFVTTEKMVVKFDFHVIPILRNSGFAAVYPNTPKRVTSADFSATSIDVPAASLIFGFYNKTNCCFVVGPIPDCSQAVDEVRQSEITAGNVWFVPYGDDAPSLSADVTDDYSRSPKQRVVINFMQNASSNSQTKYVFYGISGGVGLGFFLLRQCLGYSAKNFFANDDLTDFICKKLIEKIKFSGFLGYLSKTKAASLRVAVATLLSRLMDENIGINFNMELMSAEDKKTLIGIIVNQIYKSLIPRRSCCARTGRFFADFCTAEISPELFVVNMDKVVAAVKEALKKYKARKEVDAFELQDTRPAMVVNQLHASSSGVTIGQIAEDNKGLEKAIKEYKA